MATHHLALLLLAALLPAAAIGADPDAVQDFCVPDPGRGRPVELNLIRSYPCRSPANLTAGDFAFSGARAAGTPATVYGTFNSENPGIVRIPATVFGSGIRDAVLERAFGLTVEELRRIEKRFGVPKKAELED
ncbi:hypothetical protein TRIUR3_05699 [Triticum urartu]|uniref:Cupin type-1 domain-containing protein n=1 Tax=Triticum urartu TaxID=4572 RepID=M7ZVB9_TRIUA|nr:hypothetical protein TRIUR3_05699 [Triticum urartu]